MYPDVYAQVTVLEHALQVCSHLYQMGDFMSLKYLLSAARACISQQHHTHVSWKVLFHYSLVIYNIYIKWRLSMLHMYYKHRTLVIRVAR